MRINIRPNESSLVVVGESAPTCCVPDVSVPSCMTESRCTCGVVGQCLITSNHVPAASAASTAVVLIGIVHHKAITVHAA